MKFESHKLIQNVSKEQVQPSLTLNLVCFRFNFPDK